MRIGIVGEPVRRAVAVFEKEGGRAVGIGVISAYVALGLLSAAVVGELPAAIVGDIRPD